MTEKRTYTLTLYQRTRPGGTTGERVASWEITATGLSPAMQIAETEHLNDIDFNRRFAVLEGDTGFVHFWLSEEHRA